VGRPAGAALIGRRFARIAAPALAALALAACAPAGGPGGARGEGGPPDGDARRGPPESQGGPSLGSMRSRDEARQWLLAQNTRQLAEAQRQLRLTPAQVPAWDAYAASVGALVHDLGRFDADPVNATSMQRMDRRVDRARNLYTALEGVSEAMRGLYAVLSDEQRLVADRVLAGTVPSLYEGSPFAAGPAESLQRQRIDAQPPRRTSGSAPAPR